MMLSPLFFQDPVPDSGTDFIVYHVGDPNARDLINLIQKCPGLISKFAFHDVRKIFQRERDPRDPGLEWFWKRNVTHTPAIYDCKTREVHYGTKANNLIGTLVTASLSPVASSLDNRRLVQDHGAANMELKLSLQEMQQEISKLRTDIVAMRIEMQSGRNEILGGLRKLLSANSSAPGLGIGPAQSSLRAGPTTGAVSLGSPPGSPTSAASNLLAISSKEEVQVKVTRGKGTMLEPMIEGKLTEPPREAVTASGRAPLDVRASQRSRENDLNVWQLHTGGGNQRYVIDGDEEESDVERKHPLKKDIDTLHSHGIAGAGPSSSLTSMKIPSMVPSSTSAAMTRKSADAFFS